MKMDNESLRMFTRDTLRAMELDMHRVALQGYNMPETRQEAREIADAIQSELKRRASQ